MNLFFFIIFLFFSSVGVIYFFNIIQHIFLNDQKSSKNIHYFKIIKLAGHMENLEYIVRKHIFNNNHNCLKKCYIIFVNDGLDKETEKILLILRQTYNITVCLKEEVHKTISEKIKQQL